MKKKCVYLAGPMRGIPEFNFPQFHRYASQLRALGYDVTSPAEMDQKEYGQDCVKGMSGDISELPFSLRDIMKRDFLWIMDHIDAIALMPGWSGSRGALCELALAEYLELEVMYLAEE